MFSIFTSQKVSEIVREIGNIKIEVVAWTISLNCPWHLMDVGNRLKAHTETVQIVSFECSCTAKDVCWFPQHIPSLSFLWPGYKHQSNLIDTSVCSPVSFQAPEAPKRWWKRRRRYSRHYQARVISNLFILVTLLPTYVLSFPSN